MPPSMVDRPGGHRPVASVSWYGAMGLVGFGFGLLSDRRPFGDELFVHPLLLFVILTGLSLLALRVLLARPVPEVISDRSLLAGCAVGLVLFLAGNFVASRFPFLG
jgi:hypothetical protein